MSTLPGGPADKAGNTYEALWGVVGMVSVLGGEADVIRIEEPGTDGAEFYLEKSAVHEHWQAKRQVLSQKTWSLQLLKSEGIISFFRQRIDAGESCVFASITDAPEFRGLSENARAAEDWNEFKSKFLASDRWEAHFKEIHKHLGYRAAADVFNFLRKVRVASAGESTIEALLLPTFNALFTGAPQTVLAILRDFYTVSVHRKLTAEDIFKHLESHGISARTLPVSAGLCDLVEGITATYIAGQQSKLIRGESIPRQACVDIIQKIRDSKTSLDVLITAPAGGGKSAGLLQVVTGLVAAGIPVIAFRLDRIEPVASTEALGQKLNLPESPAIVLSQCFPGKPMVLVIDQLDFVSATSGRHPNFFEVVAALADEVRGLRGSRQIHLVMACRQFDFDHDSRIRRLLPANEGPVALALLSDTEVKGVVLAEGGDSGVLSNKQIDLLRLPQNLSLFIESGLGREKSPVFVTQKELLDLYWEAKRRAVSERCPVLAAQWGNVMAKLTDEMSKREELSVPKARLDEFSPELLAVMAAEGVLSIEGQRYGFGHESLFDYCFARTIAASESEFVEFLESDQQELFRRAQLRQVLVYLRDEDFKRYIRNVGQALASNNIRPHLKLLVMELVAAFPDPRDEEFQALEPYLVSELSCRVSGSLNPDRMHTRAWSVFFGSRTMFVAADRLGHLQQWLNSEQEQIEDAMTFYLRAHIESNADRVAELLEPFVGRGGRWNDRLRYMMEWLHHGKGRRFFDLFLRLIDDGTLDDARNRFAMNGTFWSILYGLAETLPVWCAEVASRWLNRRVAIAKNVTDPDQRPDLDDEFGVDDLFTSARGAPKEFLACVLPAVLHASESFVYADQDGLQLDRIWPIRFRGQHISMSEAYLASCETAIEQIGAVDPDSLKPLVSTLRKSRLYIANHFLQTVYLTAPQIFANEAMCLLADESERLECGCADSPFWTARTLIEKCSALCSDDCFGKIEATLLGFTVPYELDPDRASHRGYAAYSLASALDRNRISAGAQLQLEEWQSKFGSPPGPPRGIRSYSVVSPIPQEEAADMSDEQWLVAISTHSSEHRAFNCEHPERGGASELAVLFQEFVKTDPDRFGRLALRFPAETNPSYFMNVLYGLKKDGVDSQLKLDVAGRVYESDQTACLMAALDLVATVVEIHLPDEAVRFIQRMATEHSHPEATDAEGDDLLFRGMNSVRGHAIEAIRDLIFHDKAYLEVFRDAIEHSVRDPSLAVRACAASTIHAVCVHDSQLAIALFQTLLECDDRLLAAPYIERFLSHALRHHPNELLAIVERMLRSANEKAKQAGGRLACLARLYHQNINDLSEAALAGDLACRFGAAEVARQNLTLPDCRSWCESSLKRLFNDEDEKVRREAAHCFWQLWQQPELPLADYDPLIRSFLDSSAFAEEPTFLLHAIDDTRQRVPETILDVCETFVAKCSEKARDISTSLAGDEMTVGKLVFRAYAQLDALPLRKRALNLIDEMCAEGLQSAGTHLIEFER